MFLWIKRNPTHRLFPNRQPSCAKKRVGRTFHALGNDIPTLSFRDAAGKETQVPWWQGLDGKRPPSPVLGFRERFARGYLDGDHGSWGYLDASSMWRDSTATSMECEEGAPDRRHKDEAAHEITLLSDAPSLTNGDETGDTCSPTKPIGGQSHREGPFVMNTWDETPSLCGLSTDSIWGLALEERQTRPAWNTSDSRNETERPNFVLIRATPLLDSLIGFKNKMKGAMN